VSKLKTGKAINVIQACVEQLTENIKTVVLPNIAPPTRLTTRHATQTSDE